FSWWRSTRISISSEASDRNRGVATGRADIDRDDTGTNADEAQHLLRLAALIIGTTAVVRSGLLAIRAIRSDESGGKVCSAVAGWALRNTATLTPTATRRPFVTLFMILRDCGLIRAQTQQDRPKALASACRDSRASKRVDRSPRPSPDFLSNQRDQRQVRPP